MPEVPPTKTAVRREGRAALEAWIRGRATMVGGYGWWLSRVAMRCVGGIDGFSSTVIARFARRHCGIYAVSCSHRSIFEYTKKLPAGRYVSVQYRL
jgi:hypothetical protein